MDVCRASAISSLALLGFAVTAAAGEIQGTVHLDGELPAPTTVTIASKSEHHPIEGCGALTKRSPQLIVDAHGGVQNAVVWVEMPSQLHESSEEVTRTLDQRECMFEPHLILMPAGGTLAIRNPDPVLHNVRIFQERTMLMHEWQQPQGPDLTWRFDEPGRYLVRCGVHAWMHAWIVVAEHGYYALTDSTGGFTIPEVPQGDVILHVWHETLGELTQRVHVQAERSVVMIQFSGRTAIQ